MEGVLDELSEVIALRLTEDDRQTLERKAYKAGKTLSEWAREILLGTIQFAPDYRALLAEFLAQRAIINTVVFDLCSGAPLTQETFKKWISQADEKKFQLADERIAKYITA